MPDDLPARPVADNFARRFAPPELYDPKKRREWKLGRHDRVRGPYVIEFNLQHIEGLSGASAALDTRLAALNGADPAPPRPDSISKTYARCMLTVDEWQRLLVEDGKWAAKEAQEAQEAQDASKPPGSTPSGPPMPERGQSRRKTGMRSGQRGARRRVEVCQTGELSC